MLKNERQYKYARAHVARLRDLLADLESRPHQDRESAELLDLEVEAVRAQIAEIEPQIDEYETLRSGEWDAENTVTLASLPDVLVKARIASGMTQRELAERLDMKEQQIQRYEATGYMSASLKRLRVVADALGLEDRAVIEPTPVKLSQLRKRLEDAGIDRTLQARLGSSRAGEPANIISLASKLGRVYGIDPDTILAGEEVEFDATRALAASFKIPKTAVGARTAAQAVYAHYVALLVLDSVEIPVGPVPDDSAEVRATILDRFGELTFRTALDYVWSIGIPVVPLRHGGGFHAALWREAGRHVIVLKQGDRKSSRWLFDLVHELGHASADPTNSRLSVVDMESGATEGDEEVFANAFAGDVLLDGQADALAKACAESSGGRVQRLKAVVPVVADEAGVAVADLANYLAYRLSRQGMNWWGTANNLQADDDDPWRVARDRLIENIDASRISRIDCDQLLLELHTTQERTTHGTTR